MTSPRLAPLLFVALLPCWGCGSSCGRDDAGTTGGSPPTTAVQTTTSTTTSTSPPADGRYTLHRPSYWEVGEVLAIESFTSTTGRITQVSPDGRSSRLPAVKERVRATWVERTTDVDADGRRTRYLVHLLAWSRKSGRLRDGSIEGTSLAVSGVGAERRWSFVRHAHPPTDEARNWLDEHFGSRGLSDEQWLRVTLPDDRIAVGESWSPDPVLFGREAAGSGMRIDHSNAKTTVTLEGIEGGSARCLFRGTFALLRVPHSDLEWSKGGTMAFEGEMSVSLEPAPLRLSALRRKAALQGEVMQEGATVRYDFVSEERRTTTPGGSFSEPGR